jgi:hypothetical protein
VKRDPSNDRRRFARLPSDSLISIAQLDTRTALAHALDVSIGGVRFQALALDLRQGEVVRVTFTFGDDTLSVVGQVLRAEALDEMTQDVAVAFLKMSDDARRMLEAHLPSAEESVSGDQRRKLSRIPIDTGITVTRANVVDMVAQAQDVSAGGVHFVVEGIELELGDVLRVMLDVGGQPVSVIGQLVRVTDIGDFKQEAALAFLDVTPEVLALLNRHFNESSHEGP